MEVEKNILPEPIVEAGELEVDSTTLSVRGMSSAIEQRLEDQLLPPIDKKRRKEWKRLRANT